MNILSSVFFSLLLLASGYAFSADLQREARLHDEIVDAILDGDPVELKAKGHTFLGIYTEPEEVDSNRAVLILHGRGMHPDWVDTVQPLRVGLAEQDWNTLSIQLPVLEKQAEYNEYVPLFAEASPRIDAALGYLREQGNKTVVVIAHSCGYHMANHWFLNNTDAVDQVDGLIGIGMGATDYLQPMQEPFVLEELHMPILDIYGEDDYPGVHRLAEQRAQQVKNAGSLNFHQIVVPGANHYFTNKGDDLVQVIGTWLRETTF